MFSNRLKELRTKRGLLQSDIANLLGVKQTNISLYESGKNEPSIQTLIKLADYFDVSLDYLLGRDSRPPESGLAADLNWHFAQLDRRDQERLCEIAKAFLLLEKKED